MVLELDRIFFKHDVCLFNYTLLLFKGHDKVYNEATNIICLLNFGKNIQYFIFSNYRL